MVTVTAAEGLVCLGVNSLKRWNKSYKLCCVETVGETKVESSTMAAGNQRPAAENILTGTFSDPPTKQ